MAFEVLAADLVSAIVDRMESSKRSELIVGSENGDEC